MEYTLAFDVYGTLIDTSGVFGPLEKVVGEKAKLFMETWRLKQLEYSFRRGLMGRFVDFSVCTRDALEFSCLSLQISLREDEKQLLTSCYSTLPVFSDVKPALGQLKAAGHRLFAFSNGGKNALVTLLTNAGIMADLDGIVSVEDVQVFKPSPKVYAHFNKSTGSEKKNSYLISGNPFDVIGAASYGMRSAWVQRSSTQVYDPWGIAPTIIVKDLTELKSKI